MIHTFASGNDKDRLIEAYKGLQKLFKGEMEYIANLDGHITLNAFWAKV